LKFWCQTCRLRSERRLSAALEASGRRWIVPHERKCRIRLCADEAHGVPPGGPLRLCLREFNDEVVNIRETSATNAAMLPAQAFHRTGSMRRRAREAHQAIRDMNWTHGGEVKPTIGFLKTVSLLLGLVMASVALCRAEAHSGTLQYEVDPAWPKPLPENWVTGQVSGVCVDGQDHVFIVNRNDMTSKEAEVTQQAPPFIEFDADGKVVNSFGDWKAVPNTTHGCTHGAFSAKHCHGHRGSARAAARASCGSTCE
jgi:hypothetical protein